MPITNQYTYQYERNLTDAKATLYESLRTKNYNKEYSNFMLNRAMAYTHTCLKLHVSNAYLNHNGVAA